MREVVIAPLQEGKGRTFRATLVASVEADRHWQGGHTSGDTQRPVMAMFAGSEQELKAFVANLRTGRKAAYPHKGYRRGKEDRLEFLKSSGFQVSWQRESEASVATLFHPELFRIDPGMVDEQMINFILLPSKEWHSQQKIDTTPIIKHVRKCEYSCEVPEDRLQEWSVTAYLFTAYLDRRTARPIINDPRFYAQLMLSCLDKGLATLSTQPDYHYHSEKKFGVHNSKSYLEFGLEQVGLLPGIAFHSGHESFEEVLAKEVELFFKLTKGRK